MNYVILEKARTPGAKDKRKRRKRGKFEFTWSKPGFEKWSEAEKKKPDTGPKPMPLLTDEQLDAYQRRVHGLPPKEIK